MNDRHLASIVFGVVTGFYTTIFLLCLSDVVYLNKAMIRIQTELTDIQNPVSDHRSMHSSVSPLISSWKMKNLSGQLCFSYSEQSQILSYINFLSNMAILVCGIYSIFKYGFGTEHGLAYRLIFFLVKIVTILFSICLNLSFNQRLPSDIFLYIWIDVNCIASIFRTLRQRIPFFF